MKLMYSVHFRAYRTYHFFMIFYNAPFIFKSLLQNCKNNKKNNNIFGCIFAKNYQKYFLEPLFLPMKLDCTTDCDVFGIYKQKPIIFKILVLRYTRNKFLLRWAWFLVCYSFYVSLPPVEKANNCGLCDRNDLTPFY